MTALINRDILPQYVYNYSSLITVIKDIEDIEDIIDNYNIFLDEINIHSKTKFILYLVYLFNNTGEQGDNNTDILLEKIQDIYITMCNFFINISHSLKNNDIYQKIYNTIFNSSYIFYSYIYYITTIKNIIKINKIKDFNDLLKKINKSVKSHINKYSTKKLNLLLQNYYLIFSENDPIDEYIHDNKISELANYFYINILIMFNYDIFSVSNISLIIDFNLNIQYYKNIKDTLPELRQSSPKTEYNIIKKYLVIFLNTNDDHCF